MMTRLKEYQSTHTYRNTTERVLRDTARFYRFSSGFYYRANLGSRLLEKWRPLFYPSI